MTGAICSKPTTLAKYNYPEAFDGAPAAYLRAKLFINAAGVGDTTETKVRMRLLEKLVDIEMQSVVSCDELLQLCELMVTDWNKLSQECKHRNSKCKIFASGTTKSKEQCFRRLIDRVEMQMIE